MHNTATVLFSAMKNEGPFILEWVAHHRAIGFNEIIVVSNDCDDGSAELLDALDASGYVTHRIQTVPPDTAPQTSAVQTLEREYDLDKKWVLWLDADEFLNIHVNNGSLNALIAALDDAEGMAINWRVFGTNGMHVWQGENITSRQTCCAERAYTPHQAVKTLFRYGESFTHMDVHAPHAAPGREHAFYVLDSGGQRIRQRSFFYGKNGEPRHRARVRNVVEIHKIAQINHYALRSREAFAFKMVRGDGTMTAAENDNRSHNKKVVKFRHGRKFWRKYDLNNCHDDSILRYQKSTARLMNEMLEQPAVKAAYMTCCDRFSANRQALEKKIELNLISAKRSEFLKALDT